MAIKIGLFAKVLVDVPGLPPLDYRIPDDLLVAVGDLVVVPLGVVVLSGLWRRWPMQPIVRISV